MHFSDLRKKFRFVWIVFRSLENGFCFPFFATHFSSFLFTIIHWFLFHSLDQIFTSQQCRGYLRSLDWTFFRHQRHQPRFEKYYMSVEVLFHFLQIMTESWNTMLHGRRPRFIILLQPYSLKWIFTPYSMMQEKFLYKAFYFQKKQERRNCEWWRRVTWGLC